MKIVEFPGRRATGLRGLPGCAAATAHAGTLDDIQKAR
jgi:hypothetical protein